MSLAVFSDATVKKFYSLAKRQDGMGFFCFSMDELEKEYVRRFN